MPFRTEYAMFIIATGWDSRSAQTVAPQRPAFAGEQPEPLKLAALGARQAVREIVDRDAALD